MRPRSVLHAAPLLLAALLVGAAAPIAAQGCADVEGFDRLDFWIGEWDVLAGDRPVGRNRIEKILGGCAVTETWTGAGGGEGRSLFYYLPRSGEWKQVWVTDTATRVGGVKEKSLVDVLEGGALRFQGRVADAAGQLWYDRTTLTPLPGGRVRQHLEISSDGQTWETIFDAVYVRAGARAGAGTAAGDGPGRDSTSVSHPPLG